MARIAIRASDIRFLPLRARIPFRYGIATLTAVPQALVFLDVEMGGRVSRGVAADVLPPKWFTKEPGTPYAREAADMIGVIRAACQHAIEVGEGATLFSLCRQVAAAQARWATAKGLPPLLSGFGVSLVERAAIDAFCRHRQTTFARAARENLFGIDLGALHPKLAGAGPGELLPSGPLRRLRVRHTVGLSDPLADTDIAEGERAGDGLPHSLEHCILLHGLTHFKIKVPAEPREAAERLARIAALVEKYHGEYAFTLDGNEFLPDVDALRALWAHLMADPRVSEFIRCGLIALEQPLRRDAALDDATRDGLLAWEDRPPIIIDESDSGIGCLPRALECGYVGTSHKNCKGVIKGIASACLIEHRRRLGARQLILTGEDLVNFGPVAPLQDIAVVAALGIEHAERNGHHYIGNLRAYPRAIWREVMGRHWDLYREDGLGGPPVLDVRNGALAIGSAVDAPFGYAGTIKPEWFRPIEDWRPEGDGTM